MPEAMRRPCAEPGCPALVPSGYCPAHRGQRDRHRGTARSRGYTSAWERFRIWVRRRMVALGIAPVCGASLPGGPDLSLVSRCQADGRLTGQGLELHHEPPLTEAERQDPRAVCDPKRVGWLCKACHSAETARLVAEARRDGLYPANFLGAGRPPDRVALV